MRREVLKAVSCGLGVTLLLAALIVAGSRNLGHFDAALVAYTFATLFAAFGITYRYSMWLQRPPTAMYWRRGWQVFLQPRHIAQKLRAWLARVGGGFMLNNFIWRRGKGRWLAHWLIMWGCLAAVAITFPLVFGWIHFQTLPEDLGRYQIFFFGFPTNTIEIGSPLAFFIFHGLVWSSFMVTAGVMLAMRRRMREHGAAAVQNFSEDILPLVMLYAISVTGLLLWVSYTWMHGYAYDFLAILHAITVIFTLLWLPFGKFFHIFQRPAQIGVAFYKDAGREGAQAHCRRCGDPYASELHVQDLIQVECSLGYQYETDTAGVEHYQRICPGCRRRLVALAQGALVQKSYRGSE